jgi:predicted AlkP superfamily pyrophosphatase or phosphodiesterase
MKRVPVVLSAIAALAIALSAAGPLRATVLLISLDGWRWDYHTKSAVPNLRSLMERGVRAEGLVPSFPTKTFPNHYTLVTGLYPGHHGIVANVMRDPRSGRLFTMTKREEVGNAMWWGGQPLWNAVQRAGARSGPMFWPGSEAPIQGVRPSFWIPFDHRMPNDERVDRVLGWLDLPANERPSFLTLYFSDVDAAGHSFGPDSPEVVRALESVDASLGRLLRGLDKRALTASINIIVTSDHGMAETSRRRVVFIDEHITAADGELVDLNPTLGVWPRPGREEAVYRKLVAAHPRLTVYRRANTPEHWRYREHERIPPIVGVAEEGWSVMRRASVTDAFARNFRRVGGNHGYDPQVKSMQGLFVAAGPAFRRGIVVPPFENVHVYGLMCRVLGIEAAANDGDPEFGTTTMLLPLTRGAEQRNPNVEAQTPNRLRIDSEPTLNQL